MKPIIRNLLLMVLMLLCAALTALLRPSATLASERPAIDLAAMLPTTFGDWTEQSDGISKIVDPQIKTTIDAAYSQVLARTYINNQGYRIMLSVAYGSTQRGNLQLHHPEVCYPAQGFEVQSNRTGELLTSTGSIPVRRLETQYNKDRIEPVTYWAMVGDQVVLGSVQRKLVEMRYGLSGQIADGLLFRVSSIDPHANAGFEQQTLFVSQLLAALTPAIRHRVSGLSTS